MAGTLLSPDQVRKINQAFPALMAHLRTLLAADHSGVGLMRVHGMVETFDTDEMVRIFREISFISPREKLALVRAAIYELMAREPALFVAAPVVTPEMVGNQLGKQGSVAALAQTEPQVFTPARFNLNVNRTTAFHGERPADTPPPTPIVTSTHTSKVSEQLKAGDKEQAVQKEKIQAAVAKLHEASKPIELMEVPADAVIGIDPAIDGPDKTVVAEIAPDGKITVQE